MAEASRHIGEHDWHSRQYVDDWIARDISRDAERAAMLRQMLERAPFSADTAVRVLDVGAGYGMVTAQVLRRFPQARVTLLDYSAPMFEHARERLREQAAQLEFIQADLRDPEWTVRAGGSYDLAVSAIAIHNLRDHALIARCYAAIASVLGAGGVFLDCDLVSFSGGLDGHLKWLREAGFARVECVLERSPLAILAAIR